MSGNQVDIAQALTVLGDYFDMQFYTQRYPDIDANQVNPLEHYIAFGWKEGEIRARGSLRGDTCPSMLT